MLDIIQIPFGYLLDFLESTTGSYGIALILFSLILKIILLPMSCKSKKSAMKMARIAPRVKALEIECGEDKNRYSQEVSKLYKEEGLGCTGGCLWSFLPLLLLIPLYTVIREPLTYILHLDDSVVGIIKSALQIKDGAFWQVQAAASLMESKEVIRAALETAGQNPAIVDSFREINFWFLGLDMSQIPQWKIWEAGKVIAANGWSLWQYWGLFLMPIISTGSQMLSGLLTQLTNNKVVTNDKGEQDKAAQDKANSTNRTMLLLMPLMTLFFCFTMPAAISIYWFAQSIFGTVQDLILSKYYGKKYAAEDEKRREAYAILREKELERERLREERRQKYGEEGLLDPNTSKKKLKQQEEAARKAAANAYAASKNPVTDEEPETDADKHFSGDPERPYCRGRAYKPTRYGRKADQE